MMAFTNSDLEFSLEQAFQELVSINFKIAIPEVIISKLQRNYSSEEVGTENG